MNMKRILLKGGERGLVDEIMVKKNIKKYEVRIELSSEEELVFFFDWIFENIKNGELSCNSDARKVLEEITSSLSPKELKKFSKEWTKKK